MVQKFIKYQISSILSVWNFNDREILVSSIASGLNWSLSRVEIN